MNSKISLKRPWVILSILAIIFCSVITLFLTLGLPSQGSLAKSASPVASLGDPALPVGIQDKQNVIEPKPVKTTAGSVLGEHTDSGLQLRLTIPIINVDASIESVGLTSSGAMDAPKGATNVGWFNLGPRPGEEGSAVIDGHFGWWKNGTPAVFENLNKLQKGDKLFVEDEMGTVATFVVRESRSYDPKADASDVFGSNDGKAHLNLITCEGTWNADTKSYSNRLVVFTDKE